MLARSSPEAKMKSGKAKIASQGQITVPKRVRKHLGLLAGDEIEISASGGGHYNVRKLTRESPFTLYLGYLAHLDGEDADVLVDALRGR
jgi:AbrB family looped-hinge helix DNA binding protein